MPPPYVNYSKNWVDLPDKDPPGAPPTGLIRIYVTAGGLAMKDSAGDVTTPGGGSSTLTNGGLRGRVDRGHRQHQQCREQYPACPLYNDAGAERAAYSRPGQ